MKAIEYKKFLKEQIFKTEEYDQFNLMFKDFENLKNMNYSHCAILERSYMYNGKSIFVPLLNQKKKNTSINFMIPNYIKRLGIQNNLLNNLRFDLKKSTLWIKDYQNNFRYNFKKIDSDLLLIPNSLHHISNFEILIKQLAKKMPKLKFIYIFDSYLREGHQIPYDYCRYTTYALENLMDSIGFKIIKTNETGNIFDAILYLFSQSKKILDNKELNKIKKIYEDDLKLSLITQRKKKKWSSLGRKYAKMHTAYSMIFKKR